MIIGSELNEGISDKSNEKPTVMRRAKSALSSLSPTAATLAQTFLLSSVGRTGNCKR
jgi:hypothetical protein